MKSVGWRVRFVGRGVSVAVAVLVSCLLLVWSGVSSASPAGDGLWTENGRAENVPTELLQLSDALSKLVERLRPAVVQVGVAENRDSEREQPTERPFGPDERPRVGSGFIIHPDGFILTNHHVLVRSPEIEVELFGGEKLMAAVAGRDARTDLALLKIDPPRPLTAIPLGDSDALKVGELVLAIGNPFGLDYSVTMGVVSRKGRAFGAGGPYDEYIQTDAAINPGNSGGPLLNLRGEVIGINTATVPGRHVGFAIPINLAKTLLPELKQFGKIRWGFLGVSIQELTPVLARAFGVEKQGVLVNQVIPGQPAERAGLKTGDVIVGFDGMPVENVRDLQRKVGRTPIGTTALVKVFRKGNPEELTVKIGQLPEPGTPTPDRPKKQLGLTVEALDQEKAKKFKLKEDDGLVVTEVAKDSPAARAGLQPGDLIKEVNQQSVASMEEYHRSLGDSSSSGIDLLLVKRGAGFLYVAIRPKN